MSDPNYLEYLKLKRHGLLEDTTHTKPITLTPSENQQGYQGGGRSRKHVTNLYPDKKGNVKIMRDGMIYYLHVVGWKKWITN